MSLKFFPIILLYSICSDDSYSIDASASFHAAAAANGPRARRTSTASCCTGSGSSRDAYLQSRRTVRFTITTCSRSDRVHANGLATFCAPHATAIRDADRAADRDAIHDGDRDAVRLDPSCCSTLGAVLSTS
jgi:hypothetical protein